jgi:hypothetical protein
MICYPPEAEFWLISGGCELPCAFPTGHEQSQTEFDIFISRDLYFSRLIRGANCYKEPCSTDTAKKEILSGTEETLSKRTGGAKPPFPDRRIQSAPDSQGRSSERWIREAVMQKTAG